MTADIPARTDVEALAYQIRLAIPSMLTGLPSNIATAVLASGVVVPVSRVEDAEASADEALATRDVLEERLDGVAYSLATVEEIGEHSSGNDPWENVIDHVAGKIQRLERERDAALADLASWVEEARAEAWEQGCKAGNDYQRSLWHWSAGARARAVNGLTVRPERPDNPYAAALQGTP